MLDRIVSATPLPQYRVRIDYSDGVSGIVDFSKLIQHGPVFAPMADPAFFASVRVGERGRSLEWPREIDFCADALRMKIDAAASENVAVAAL